MWSYFGSNNEESISMFSNVLNTLFSEEEDALLQEDDTFTAFNERFLAKLSADEKPSRSDYSILSVSVMTLGLIMFVELMRHKIDHLANGRPFAMAVLDGVYRELTTLGLVEFFIWVLLTYWESINIAKEKVFAKVHFTLFYTAILNAFQTVIVAFFTTRISRRQWVDTEMLELNHYVEIREEFERVSAELNQIKIGQVLSQPNTNCDAVQKVIESDKYPKSDVSSSTKADEIIASGSDSHENSEKKPGSEEWENKYTEEEFEFNARGLRSFYENVRDTIRYPTLYRRYNALLLQVRFHELRVHFLQAYKLPLKFKVSDYLIRSEQQILTHLVHVSTVAWLLLTASINLLYYIMGVIMWQTERPKVIGYAMTYIFFASMGVFILISLLVYNKIRKIFRTIMNMRELWDITVKDDSVNTQLAERQRSLFWGSDPALIISAIQFMQFGYAVALAVCLIFWDDITKGKYVIYSFILAIFGCYAIFVSVTVQILPRYTLCTSLGQLANRQRLQETVAAFHLQETRRQRQWELEVAQYKLDSAVTEREIVNFPRSTSHDSLGKLSSQNSSSSHGQLHSRSGSSGKTPATVGTMNSHDAHSQSDIDPAELMAELVKLDTNSLRTNLPDSEREQLSLRDQTRARRNWRRLKAVSDGVSAMAAVKPTSSTSKTARDDFYLGQRFPSRGGSQVSLNNSESSGPSNADKLSPLDTNAEQLAARKALRKRRMKTVSDGVAIMAQVTRSLDSKNSIGAMSPPLVIKMNEHQDVRLSPSLTGPKSASAILDKPKPDVAGMSTEMPSLLDQHNSANLMDDDAISEGGHSDTDDIPEVLENMLKESVQATSEAKKSLKDKLHRYYISRKFIAYSNVCGTMVAFFCIGERVERFLHTDGIVTPDFVSFDFHQGISFYALTVWMFMFLINDGLIFWILRSVKKPMSKKERCVGVAAAMDFLLISACIVILFVAESQRCCDDSDGLSESVKDYIKRKSKKGTYNLEPAPCSCPVFGTRTYSGLGYLEPYVAILALRLLRHWFSKRIVSLFDSRLLQKGRLVAYPNPFNVFGNGHNGHDDHDDHGHGHGDGRGSAVELWETAVGNHPGIVERYGKFSGELLQAMLGLPVAIEAQGMITDKGVSVSPSGKSFALSKEYSNLTPHAQEIVMAGKLGQQVKAQPATTLSGVGDLPAPIPEEDDNHDSPRENLVFQVDNSVPTFDEANSLFIVPRARLVRSMRRCERKLLPYLDHWTVVDVVMTRHEMVYFDATDVDGPAIDDDTDDTRAAITATKGGKGLRLCDVCVGRKVVGHMSFSDIKSMHVERTMPTPTPTSHNNTGLAVDKLEYWSKEDASTAKKERNWHEIKQDCVRIDTVHGHTLVLRYYADFEDCEHHMERMQGEDEVSGDLYKNNAFQWVQTIGRFCGPERLQQSLEHFGADTSDELRDYLVVVTYDNEQKKTRIAVPRFLTRANSVVHVNSKPAAPSRMHSMDESNTNLAGSFNWSRPKPKVLSRRSVSMNESDQKGKNGGLLSDSEVDKKKRPVSKKGSLHYSDGEADAKKGDSRDDYFHVV